MSRNRLLITALAGAVLVLLVYLQFRAWKDFNWGTFWAHTRSANFLYVAAAVAVIYISYWLRAWRWQIFLAPMCHTTSRRLLAPTMIGFAGLALLGRPGELVRPYLIARRENLSLTSQLGVWTVERIFDLGAFTVLLILVIFLAPNLPYLEQFRRAGFLLTALVAGIAAGTFAVRRNRTSVANGLERLLSPLSPRIARGVAHKIESYADGLNTIRDAKAFLQLLAVSMILWVLIVAAAVLVMHAYPQPLHALRFSDGVLVIGLSMLGSLVQLPAVGGGTQLAVIAGLAHIFRVPQELAVSCGILLWMVTFVAITPVGLALAHREHVSFTRISKETEVVAGD
ncbi:MAG TPA: lysylphosphatidylglycerol synthase transmembrane domain-containing protein [Terriglobales bacterium]|nr:lysylphosphatidylglycerol synthase transmembrane domain-containing protein [Terriglobales bacterium]